MNEELQATLEWLKDCGEHDWLFETGNSKILLDYITNLQQENERLKENNMSYQEEMAKTWKIADDYKSRIEKAVEYLKDNACYTDENEFVSDLRYDDCEELLNILNGRSDE